uniref:Uncharacterized protein n=1 Tax=Grammatophora oceanica TaxID=210454 RepID=A0A7S1V4G5_9STRA|mmetsp:Transcript_34899/g.51908  ORF Transcript_34899/g.51908 Transcript_34899/m.51908 type:complete len:107 (+) Transcript_34899:227-547(+)
MLRLTIESFNTGDPHMFSCDNPVQRIKRQTPTCVDQWPGPMTSKRLYYHPNGLTWLLDRYGKTALVEKRHKSKHNNNTVAVYVRSGDISHASSAFEGTIATRSIWL